MTNDEARFLLHAYRPNGADSGDPALRDALEHAQRDPALRAWFEREQAYDRVVSDKLRTITPPPGLREAILAGARVSSARAWWRRPAWLAMAASVAILLVAAFAWSRRGPLVSLDEATHVAIRDMASEAMHGSHGLEYGALGVWLENPANRLAAGVPVDFSQLRAQRCRTLRLGGRELFEICFQRGASGEWYHVYLAPRRGFSVGPEEAEPVFRQQGNVATATWYDARHVYVLATRASLDALRGVL
ncbi:MAG TPA: hypothetical protein VGD81_15090 [Opitutaceae bacterium]